MKRLKYFKAFLGKGVCVNFRAFPDHFQFSNDVHMDIKFYAKLTLRVPKSFF